jgi:imidazolonepropionase
MQMPVTKKLSNARVSAAWHCRFSINVSELRTLWLNARVATCDTQMQIFERGALIVRGDRIEWVGPEQALPETLRASAGSTRDLNGRWITPALIDCHTHLIYAANRAAEFAARLKGISYEEIARQGGGIASTMRATRAASEQQLFEESAPRLESLLNEGVGTLEIKSGYGLTLEDEAKMLRVARKLAAVYPVTIKTTFLGAHALPPEYAGKADDYIDALAEQWLPRLCDEGLVDAVDAFCERIAFNVTQCERLFKAAQKLRLPIKMHAEQLSNIGGSQLAARHAALSCDHLEHATAEDIEALVASKTVAVLLPIAFYSLAETRRPPIDVMRAKGLPIAVASDCNPGSAPGASLLLALNMACRLFGLTSEEALAGATRNGALALGVGSRGVLAPGQIADFAVWNVRSLDEFGYWAGYNPCRAVVKAGKGGVA